MRVERFKKPFLFLLMSLLVTLSCGPDYSIHQEVVEVVDPPPTHVVVDSLIQATPPEYLDVLMVLDTSCSMNNDFKNVSIGMEILRGDIETITMDYKIGFINTSLSGIYFAGPLDSSSKTIDFFMAPWTLTADYREAGFSAYYNFVTSTEEGSDFFREHADKLIIFISDEDEQSQLTPAVFHSWLSKKYANVQHDAVAIVQVPKGSCTNNYSTGDNYIELVAFYGKTAMDICDDWTTWLSTSSFLFKPIDYVNLSKTPIEDSLVVYVDEVVIEEWYYLEETNTVYLDNPPDPGALVEVGYVTYDE